MGKSRRDWINWANALTLSRVALGALCLLPATSPDPSLLMLAFVLMLLAELTDFLDGVVARATGSVTEVGKILDPMADSMYRLMIFACFVQNGWMPAWMFSIFVLRDVGVAYSRIIAVQHGLSAASRFSGKAKAVAQGVAQLFVVGAAAFQLDNLQVLSSALLYLAAAVTFYSLIDYAAAMLQPTAKNVEIESKP
jgi:CDP-diacylglycerol--glycerol-3-phosphate 3-phosphatidyltransferase